MVRGKACCLDADKTLFIIGRPYDFQAESGIYRHSFNSVYVECLIMMILTN